MVDPDGRFAFLAAGVPIALKGIVVTAPFWTATSIAAATTITATVASSVVIGSSLASSFGGGAALGGCPPNCPKLVNWGSAKGSYNNPYSKYDLAGEYPGGTLEYYGGVPEAFTPMAPVNAVASQGFNLTTIEAVQLGIDVAGFIPGLNTVSGLTSAAISLSQGQYIAAAIGVATAIPVAGVFVKATKAAITGVKVLKTARSTRRITRQVEALRGGQDIFVKNVDEARNLLRNLPELRPHVDKFPPLQNGNSLNRFGNLWKQPGGTYRGDLININDPTADFIHRSGNMLHDLNPHYNLRFFNGTKSTIIIR